MKKHLDYKRAGMTFLMLLVGLLFFVFLNNNGAPIAGAFMAIAFYLFALSRFYHYYKSLREFFYYDKVGEK
ncbi:MAG: hypothetical protein IMZ64_10690 [Bacteroidetes bacterium]|nr:hypothetical protein [Bacteroidota bacterium]